MRREQELEAALFDLDGTLVDTMPLHWEAYRRTLAKFGIDLTYEHFIAVAGGPAAAVIPMLLQGKPIDASVQDIHQQKKAETSRLLRERRPPTLETSKLLPFFWGHCKTAIVSSGSRSGVLELLEAFDWHRKFEVIIAGDDVKWGKPHPEPFLSAAAALNAAAHRCLAFEDSDAGIQSASAAGMLVYDVRKTTSAWR